MTPLSFELSHTPVLLNEVVDVLAPKDGEIYIDATFGGGGYTRAILDAAKCTVIGIDRDEEAVERGRAFEKEYPGRFSVHHAPFSHIPSLLETLSLSKVDGIVFDIGVSSFQLDDPARGFSFRFDSPLSMEMGCNDITAFDIVNSFDEKEIADILYAGEERFGRRIAKKIVLERAIKKIETTKELADLVRSAVPFTKEGSNPATLTFQALRMYVNKELMELENALAFCKTILKVHGRAIFVTFHSLEDRLVKRSFRRDSGNDPLPSRHMLGAMHPAPVFFTLPKGQPFTPSQGECKNNPRARSAKLRFGVRTETIEIETGEITKTIEGTGEKKA